MGWFKNLFVKKSSEKKELRLNETADWLDSKTKQTIEELNEKIKGYYSSIQNLQEKIKADLILLGSASYKEKVDQRVIQIVLSNKMNYIKQVDLFLSQIILAPSFDYRSAREWCLKFEKEIDNLAKSSVKSYYKTQHLFSDEVEKVARGIASLDMIFKKLKKELDNNKNIINLIELAYSKIKELEQGITGKYKLEKELKEERENYSKTTKQKSDINNSIVVLRSSKEYTHLNNLIKENERIAKEVKQEKYKLEQPFSDLRKALEKFKRMAVSDEPLIQFYILSPIKALENDPELKIIKVLGQMEKIVEKGRIELKDKKRQKTLEQIRILNKEYLSSFLKRYSKLKNNKKTVEQEIGADTIIKKEQELNDQLNKIENKLNISAGLIKEKEERLEKFNINSLKEDIKSKLQKITGISVSII